MKAPRPPTTSLMLLTSCLLTSNTTLVRTTLKLSHSQDKSHAVHKALSYLADKTKKYSNGELVIRIYPDATLGNEHESLELMSSGALQIVKANAVLLESSTLDHNLFSLPFLLHDRDHYYRVLQSNLDRKILNSSESKGFVGITYYNDGAGSFYSNRPITKPEDLAGMKIRAQQSPNTIAVMKTLGGVVTPVAQGKPYTAFQQGVVDGGENNTIVYVSMRRAEIARVYSRDEHTMIPGVLTISTGVLNRLGDREHMTLLKAADEPMMQARDVIWPTAEKKAHDKVGRTNVTVVDVDKSAFKERVKPLYDEFKAKDAQSAKNLELIKSM